MQNTTQVDQQSLEQQNVVQQPTVVQQQQVLQQQVLQQQNQQDYQKTEMGDQQMSGEQQQQMTPEQAQQLYATYQGIPMTEDQQRALYTQYIAYLQQQVCLENVTVVNSFVANEYRHDASLHRSNAKYYGHNHRRANLC